MADVNPLFPTKRLLRLLLGYLPAALCLVLFSPISQASHTIHVRAITSTFAPLQLIESGKASGYAVEAIELIAQSIGRDSGQEIRVDFQFLPWNRGFRTAASEQENVLFFSLTRSPARESLFHWVGEISPYDMHLFTLDPDLPAQFPSLQAIRESEHVIGVQDGSNVEELLRSQGYVEERDFITYSNYQIGINMLYRGRIDFVPMTSFLARGNVCGQGMDPDRLVPALQLESISRPLWVVFSKPTSTELVRRFQQALQTFNSSSRYRQLTSLHINNWTEKACEKWR